jgi:hypothetical protein
MKLTQFFVFEGTSYNVFGHTTLLATCSLVSSVSLGMILFEREKDIGQYTNLIVKYKCRAKSSR